MDRRGFLKTAALAGTAAALDAGCSPTWAGMLVLTVVLWGGVLTQVLWVGWKSGMVERGQD